ncbi:outer membrane beta-barrel protein [Dyadobacter flavalbus]|nr:outer membrane beta-barrel protein [Dyadobacter flavalbus]
MEILLSCSTGFCQSKFSFSATLAPFYAHNKTTVQLPVDSGFDPNPGGVWTSKSSSKGYWVGLNGRYSFSKKWSASTGLWFSQSRSKNSNSSSRSHNFAIPVMVNFQTSERKLSPYFSAGALWNFASTSRITTKDFGTLIFKFGKGDISRLLPTVGAGVIYHFAPHFSLIGQPTFGYAIPPSGIDSHTYQPGFNMQLMFKL